MTVPVLPGNRRRWWGSRRALFAGTSALAVLCLGLTLSVGLHRPAGAGATQPGPGDFSRREPAPPLSGRTLDGVPFDLSSLRGRLVLVNVWASWCGPCRDELPLLARAQRRWSDRGLEIVGLDVRDDPSAARGLLREAGARLPHTVVDREGTTAVSWGVRGVPETFLVRADGVIRARRRGPVDQAWLDRWVLPSLPAGTGPGAPGSPPASGRPGA